MVNQDDYRKKFSQEKYQIAGYFDSFENICYYMFLFLILAALIKFI